MKHIVFAKYSVLSGGLPERIPFIETILVHTVASVRSTKQEISKQRMKLYLGPRIVVSTQESRLQVSNCHCPSVDLFVPAATADDLHLVTTRRSDEQRVPETRDAD